MSIVSSTQSLTYMLAIHVVVEAEAVCGVGADRPVRVFGSHTEGGTQQAGFVPCNPGTRRLDVHVKTCLGEKMIIKKTLESLMTAVLENITTSIKGRI